MKRFLLVGAGFVLLGMLTAATQLGLSPKTEAVNVYEVRFENQDIPIWQVPLADDHTPEMATVIELPMSVVREHNLPGPWWKVFRKDEVRDEEGALLSRRIKLEIQTLR